MTKRLTEVTVLWKGEVVRIVTVPCGETVEVPACDGVVCEAREVEVERFVRGFVADRTSIASNAMSLLAHAGVLVAIAFIAPRMDDDTVEVQRDRVLAMKHLLEAHDESVQLHDDMRDDSGDTEGGTGAGPKGLQGAMGSPHAARSFSRFGIQGFKDNPHPTATREEALREAASFGVIGLIPSAQLETTPTPWGRAALGNEDRNANGNLWGDAVAEALGQNGFGLSGCGCDDGGGALGLHSIGVGTIGTIGHGLGEGIGGGVGSNHGHLEGGHTPGVPFLRDGSAMVNGRLPPETIQRVVRQNFGRFRACYADALAKNPSIEGRVVVKFVIDRDGAVGTASDGGSDMNASVSDCVVRRFGDLAFPAPSDGVVTVVYPLVFTPG